MNWTYFAKTTVVKDYSSYKPETCNNGGDYAFYETLRFFKAEDGRVGVLRLRTTSAEFDYCELRGSFQRTERQEFANAVYQTGGRFPIYAEESISEIEPHFERTFPDMHSCLSEFLEHLFCVTINEDGSETEELIDVEYESYRLAFGS
jgi:hypothetical protein